MFATLTRRWRIVAPAITAMVALVIVVAAMIAPASAASSKKTLHFRFSGDAADFVSYTVNPAFFDCFSGYLDPAGGHNIHSAFNDCIFPGWSNGAGLTSTTSTVAAWDVTANHNSKEGHVIAQAQLASGGTDQTFVVFNPIPGGFDNQDTDTDANGNVVPDDPEEDNVKLFEADHLKETAEAECQGSGGRGHAHVRAQMDTAELVVLHDIPTDLEGNNSNGSNNSFDAVNAAVSGAFGSLVITRTFDVDGTTYTLILMVNEQTKWGSGDHAAISANALRIIVQDENGNILADDAVAHVHADIQCAYHTFHFEDPIGA